MSPLQLAVDDFLAEVKSGEHASLNTYLAYKSDLGQLVAYLEGTSPAVSRWESVDVASVDGYIAHLQLHGYGKSTVARKIAAAKALFRTMGDHSVIPENPLHRMKLPKLERHPPFTLSEAEVTGLIAAAGITQVPRALRDRALLAVLYGTGMRVSEVISLKLDELHLTEGWIHCVTRINRARRIPLNRDAIQYLNDYLATGREALLGSEPTTTVFLNPSGSGLTRQAVWMLIRNYARAAGIAGAVTPHTLRHSRASHMLSAGEDVRRVKEWLGHANLSTTQAYGARLPMGATVPIANTQEAVDTNSFNQSHETANLTPAVSL